MRWPVVSTLFQEKMDHHNRKDGFRETGKLDRYWKSRPVACVVNVELRLEFGFWVKTTLNPEIEFLMDQINLWWIRTTTTQKFLKISLKNKRYNWMWRVLHTDQRQNQNHKEGNLLVIHRVSFRCKSGIGLILNQGITLSLCVRSFEESNPSSSSFPTSTTRRGWSGSFLENQRKSSESIPTNSSLVWQSMESMLGSRRRSKKDISVLHWWFRNNCLSSSSSRTFRTQSYWSFIAGQCGNSERILPVHLPHRMCV